MKSPNKCALKWTLIWIHRLAFRNDRTDQKYTYIHIILHM